MGLPGHVDSPQDGEYVVLERPDGSVAAVEVKASATVAASDFAALQALRDQLGKRYVAGVVLYARDQVSQ